ncbi:hypothetical protein BDK51DRAFT_45726 [Blyttiomyces helicus]|uniref:Uncharacterized protein n=1 Tax=Blyttiomyces helicus TaxID=388810 RepID=A0A4V1IRF6_9FUNG|nr:hypothetical protein BDK51DRAFT_45726 [Blyttiomyces helicus]|eukprot:RKO89887.1 hypothetical protein BDK51DRAFT_45726 [Blyttiomyces helicus]
MSEICLSRFRVLTTSVARSPLHMHCRSQPPFQNSKDEQFGADPRSTIFAAERPKRGEDDPLWTPQAMALDAFPAYAATACNGNGNGTASDAGWDSAVSRWDQRQDKYFCFGLATFGMRGRGTANVRIALRNSLHFVLITAEAPLPHNSRGRLLGRPEYPHRQPPDRDDDAEAMPCARPADGWIPSVFGCQPPGHNEREGDLPLGAR